MSNTGNIENSSKANDFNNKIYQAGSMKRQIANSDLDKNLLYHYRTKSRNGISLIIRSWKTPDT